MAQTVVVKLTDDIDGGDADETVRFSLDGAWYEIDLNKRNAAKLRKEFGVWADKARKSKAPASRGRAASGSTSSGAKTLFSQLDSEEKDRFRTWAKMPTARRIGDAKVQEWMDAGKP